MACSSSHLSRTLTTAIFPLLIYIFQLLGKASNAASGIAGMLLLLKIAVELRQHRLHVPRSRQTSRRRRAPQETLAGCYFCEELHVLRPYHFDGLRVGVCQHCYRNLHLSRRTT